MILLVLTIFLGSLTDHRSFHWGSEDTNIRSTSREDKDLFSKWNGVRADRLSGILPFFRMRL